MAKTKDKPQSDNTTKLKVRVEELENNWKRALADYKNLEKRVEDEKFEYVKFANEVLLRQLLPVLDNLETLHMHISDEGLNYIIKDFKNVLANSGVEEVTIKDGDDFDPIFMDCVETVSCDVHSKGVHKVIKKAYKLKGKLLRPAVVIACGTKEEK